MKAFKPLKVVTRVSRGEFWGTKVLHLECQHTSVISISVPTPKRRRCGWCYISNLSVRPPKSCEER
jgi:hypothetical protein